LWQKVASLEKIVNPKVVGGQPTVAPTDPTGKLSKEDADRLPGVKDSDHILGNKDADVAIIVYDDWECPYCKSFHETAKQAVENYGGKVSLVYRQFPLEIECVAKLGGNDAFWKFIDSILETTKSNDGLDLTLLPKFATQAGVNLADYNACVKNGDTKEIVEKQIQEGQDAGVTGTPGSYAINKKGDVWQIPGAVPLEMLKATIDEALK